MWCIGIGHGRVLRPTWKMCWTGTRSPRRAWCGSTSGPANRSTHRRPPPIHSAGAKRTSECPAKRLGNAMHTTTTQ
jgi:hypothetical protein